MGLGALGINLRGLFKGLMVFLEPMKSPEKIYNEIKSQSDQDLKPLVVFDLDSTVFNVSYRSQKILQSFCENEEHKSRFPQAIKKLSEMNIEYTDWGIVGVLKRSKIKESLEFFELVNAHWRKHFFDNDHMKFDKLYPGVHDYLYKIIELPAKLVYLTGRNRPNMGQGTEASLEQHKLPFTEQGVELFMKPKKGDKDELYKGRVIEELLKNHSEIWLFDNEPVILRHIEKYFPQVNLVFIDTVHSGKLQPESSWMSIKAADFVF